MRLCLLPVLAALCLLATSCTVHHRVVYVHTTPAPNAPALVYVLIDGQDTTRAWVMQHARLDKDGLHGVLFELHGERAATIRTTTDDDWLARLNGSTFHYASPAWTPPQGDGIPATLPTALLVRTERVEVDRALSRKKSWIAAGISVGVTAAIVGASYGLAMAAYY